MTRRTVAAVSVGCGFLCEVRAQVDGRALTIEGACPHAAAWFGDGSAPDAIRVDGEPATFEAALSVATELLVAAHGNLLTYLAPGLSIEALRPAVALADALGAVVDSGTSTAAAQAIVAGQRRGRASATLGELANRADVVLLWGVGAGRIQCVQSRILDRAGTHVPGGRAGRLVIAVRIGSDGTLDGADLAGTLAPGDELVALSLLRSAANGHAIDPPAHLAFVGAVAERLAAARYIGIVAPAEEGSPDRAPERSESLIALAQALNGPSRAALLSLRDGGNRNGVEALLTWQSGYPMGVSYRSGTPAYRPELRALTAAGLLDGALLAGDWRSLTGAELASLPRATVLVGPRASEAPIQPRVAIDTGVLGVHEGGTVYRADDVPLSVPAVLDGARTAAMTLAALEDAVDRALRSAAA